MEQIHFEKLDMEGAISMYEIPGYEDIDKSTLDRYRKAWHRTWSLCI
jgi:hypothetical protein